MQKLCLYLAASGLCILILDLILGWALVPDLIDSLIINQLKLKNGTEMWKNWENLPVPIYLTFYIFNVSNPEQVAAGAKPEFKQLGPYVYREKRSKLNISVSKDEEFITYSPRTLYYFVAEKSRGSENDIVTTINVPFVVVTHRVDKLDYYLLKFFIREYIRGFKEKLFIKISVAQLLFQGYRQPMLEEFEAMIMERILTDKKFGLYYPKNGTDQGIFRIHSGINDAEDESKGLIESWNGKTKLEHWAKTHESGDYCNMLNGTDGTIFPRNLNKQSILQLFIPDLCRSVHLTFNSEVDFQGVPGYRFTTPIALLQNPSENPDNICFCSEPQRDKFEGCAKTGVLSISRCKKGAPLTLSLAHFYQASTFYLNQSIGLSPLKEKHETFIDIEPKKGILLRAHRRLQLNIELMNLPAISTLSRVPHMLFPIMWMDESAQLETSQLEKLTGKIFTPFLIVKIIKWAVLLI